MAISAATVWEIRTTGLTTNGGGFANLSPGVSVDYSQQDTPILTRADFLKGVGANDITTSAGVACFTQAMIGNIICMTTTTLRFYQITAVSGDLKTITVDSTVGLSSAKSGSVGGAYNFGANDVIFFGSTATPIGNILYVKAGTYTPASSSIAMYGEMIFIGYNAIRNDNPTGANRPVIDFGSASHFSIASSSSSPIYFYNLIFTGSGTFLIDNMFGGKMFASNCKFSNTNTSTSGYRAIDCIGTFVHCEFSSVKGTCISGSYIFVDCCYFHDGNTGIVVTTSGYCDIRSCVFKNFTVPATRPQAGINLVGCSIVHVYGCIFYNCSNGIVNTTSLTDTTIIVNNIFDACGTGISWYATAAANNTFDYNCYHCSVVDVFNISKGLHDITADPLFMFPLTNDFRLSAGSPCFNTGMQLGSIVGL